MLLHSPRAKWWSLWPPAIRIRHSGGTVPATFGVSLYRLDHDNPFTVDGCRKRNDKYGVEVVIEASGADSLRNYGTDPNE
jgi:hypothetical protein